MSDCVFCAIINNTAPADLVYEDSDVIVIKDIHPVAPVHLLVIPRKHIASIDALQPEDAALISRMMFTVQKIARKRGWGRPGAAWTPGIDHLDA